jgi:hypothetical protein
VRRARPALAAAGGVLAADLAWVVVTGAYSPLQQAMIGGRGFALRAALLGLLLVVRLRVIGERPRRLGEGRLLLLLLFLPTLVHFQVAGGRLNGDGTSYYAFLHSLWKDRDFDLANQYARLGMVDRVIGDEQSGFKRDLMALTVTGLRRSIYSVGPALLWSPFFGVGELFARGEVWLGAEPDTDGYGPYYTNAVALGNLLYGFLALGLVHGLLRRHFRPGTATGATLLLLGASFLYWYLVWQPTYAHAGSFCLAAYAVWLWDRDRGGPRSGWSWFYLGLILGLGMCVRWQNGVLLLLPGLELLQRLWRDRSLGRLPGAGALLGAGALIGAFPQMAAWKALYDMWVLPYPPQGTDFLRFDHPWLLETLFSSRHGLLSWTPVMWAGYLGFVPLLRRRPGLAWPLLPPLLMMSYVNLCVGDWWGGASFSNRRFDSVLPLLALGTAAAIDTARRLLAARPGWALAGIALLAALWNAALAEQTRLGLSPRDAPVAFSHLAGRAALAFSHRAGFPTTWPASWIFAWRTGLSPERYDRVVGRYLFYRQNNMNGVVDVGGVGDAPFLDGSWGPREAGEGPTRRRLRGRGRVVAGLDVPETIEVTLLAAAPRRRRGATVEIAVNGAAVGRVLVGPEWSAPSLEVPESYWRREQNLVSLDPGDAELVVDALRFRRRRSVRRGHLAAQPVRGVGVDPGGGHVEGGVADAETLVPAVDREVVPGHQRLELLPGVGGTPEQQTLQRERRPEQRQRDGHQPAARSPELPDPAQQLDEGEALVTDHVVGRAAGAALEGGLDHPDQVADVEGLAQVAPMTGDRQQRQPLHQPEDVAEVLDVAGAVHQRRSQHRVGNGRLPHLPLGLALGPGVGIVGHRDHHRRAQEHEVRDPVAAAGLEHPAGGLDVVAPVGPEGGSRDLGLQVDHGRDAGEAVLPRAGLGQVGPLGEGAGSALLQDLQVAPVLVEGQHRITALDQHRDQVLADHAGGAGDDELSGHGPLCYGITHGRGNGGAGTPPGGPPAAGSRRTRGPLQQREEGE